MFGQDADTHMKLNMGTPGIIHADDMCTLPWVFGRDADTHTCKETLAHIQTTRSVLGSAAFLLCNSVFRSLLLYVYIYLYASVCGNVVCVHISIYRSIDSSICSALHAIIYRSIYIHQSIYLSVHKDDCEFWGQLRFEATGTRAMTMAVCFFLSAPSFFNTNSSKVARIFQLLFVPATQSLMRLARCGCISANDELM